VTLIGEGLRNSAIAERLFISAATVRNHLTSILDKLELANRFELAVYAFRHGLVGNAARKEEGGTGRGC
jgi:DNA-binding NarL/FixJ family response regulator